MNISLKCWNILNISLEIQKIQTIRKMVRICERKKLVYIAVSMIRVNTYAHHIRLSFRSPPSLSYPYCFPPITLLSVSLPFRRFSYPSHIQLRFFFFICLLFIGDISYFFCLLPFLELSCVTIDMTSVYLLKYILNQVYFISSANTFVQILKRLWLLL